MEGDHNASNWQLVLVPLSGAVHVRPEAGQRVEHLQDAVQVARVAQVHETGMSVTWSFRQALRRREAVRVRLLRRRSPQERSERI